MTGRNARRAMLLVVVLCSVGCRTSFEVVNATPTPGLEVSEASKVETFHGSYWWFAWSEEDRRVSDEACRGIHKIEAQNKLWHSLVSVLSLGLWAPITLEYWCRVPVEEDSEDLDTTLPDEGFGDDEEVDTSLPDEELEDGAS